MTSASYASQAVLEEFEVRPEPASAPQTCWRAGCDGRWVDPHWLYEVLIKGSVTIQDDWLHETFLDYIEKQLISEFYNNETHEFYYAPVAKRGNMYYAVRKAALCDEISEAMSGIVFDEPVPGFRPIPRIHRLGARQG